MALSDREKAIFDNLVNGLEEDIADVENVNSNINARWIIVLVVALLTGLGLLLSAVIFKIFFLGILGFIIMLFAGYKFSLLIEK